MERCQEKRALITGGTSGIGLGAVDHKSMEQGD